MSIQRMACPACGAPIGVPEGTANLTCAHCNNALRVELGEGYAALKVAEQIGQAIQQSGQQTQDSIHHGTQVTQLELRRLQISQDMAAAQMQLANTQSEIRTLDRSQETRKTKQQLAELRSQEQAIKDRIATLQTALSPLGAQPGTEPLAKASVAKSTEMTWKTGCGWAILVWLVVGVVLVGITESAGENAQSVASLLAIVAGLGFYFYYRSRKKQRMGR